jgi:hypothetical protein
MVSVCGGFKSPHYTPNNQNYYLIVLPYQDYSNGFFRSCQLLILSLLAEFNYKFREMAKRNYRFQKELPSGSKMMGEKLIRVSNLYTVERMSHLVTVSAN